MKSNAYLQINRPIFAYSWLFLPILAYLRICSKSPRIYFAFRAEYPCLFLPIFRHLTCVGWMFGKKRTNLNVQTIESMVKIYRHTLSIHNQKSLNHIVTISNDDIKQMLDNVFEEGDLFN